jgi:DNA-binding MarR family transcriptional regulator
MIFMTDDIFEKLDKAFMAKYAERRKNLARNLRALSESFPGRMAPEQAEVLKILSELGHGVPVGEISAKLDLPHANVTRTLDRLEKKGLVRRSRSKNDRRQIIIRLTLGGNKLSRRMGELYNEALQSIWNKCSYEDKNYLLRILKTDK